MKFYVVKVNNLIKYAFLAVIVLAVSFFVLFFPGRRCRCISTKREIPIYSVDYPEKKVALTFDCAWGSEDIPDILNTLREHDVKQPFYYWGVG